MDEIKRHFEDEAREFDDIIAKLIPYYDSRMVEALVAALPFDPAAQIRVLDLGCGTGTVAQAILDRFPKAHITCLDFAENMIAMARGKLAHHSHVRYIVGDFKTFEFDGPYEAVVSSLALHHLVTNEDKRCLYRRIFECLTLGGVFYNADVVLGSSDFLQAMYIRQWRAFMRHYVTEEEIDRKWIPKYDAEDRPAKLLDQLAWLTEIGFVQVDAICKFYNFAVYGGAKRDPAWSLAGRPPPRNKIQ